jgi:hypothetical protein
MLDAAYTPHDDFPPFGYLDNPTHSWKLHPSGVLRSRSPAGMGWHRPNLGSYGRNQFRERAHLHIGIEVGGMRLTRQADFDAAGVEVRCDLHTKLRLRYVWQHPAGVIVTALYSLIDKHTLGCQIELRLVADTIHSGTALPAVRLWLALELAHNPATSRLWEHGTYVAPPGQSDPNTGNTGLLGICPEGDAWALGAYTVEQPLSPHMALQDAAGWLAHGPIALAPVDGEPEGLKVATLALGYDLTLVAGGATTISAVLAHGVSADQALAHWNRARSTSAVALANHTAEDERFWARAPQLSGDWPAHWRRGFVTDLETLRMVVRPPVGKFAGHWDGMQIQAPRLVLAEAALDALALSWADPALAREILLECFTSAQRPNVPCMREDGSYNMLADDGAICGTGPEWGWPLLVVERLWARSGDTEWLTSLYPHLAAYLDWWLTHRTGSDGWLVHACSWESGQDVSTRFGEQHTGGSDVRHLRPVDLQAAAAHGAALLARWATALDRPLAEHTRWQAESARLRAQLQSMWRDGWFHDFDTRQGRWSAIRDPMQLAPLACGAATMEQGIVLRSAFDAMPAHGGMWPALVWPPVAFTALEAAVAAGLPERASELAARILERTWRRMDGRTLEPDGALPGVTREFWPEGGRATSAGIEGYGWGALTVEFLMRHIVGIGDFTPDEIVLAPALPPDLRQPGATYSVGPLAYGRGTMSMSYHIPTDGAAGAVDVKVTLTGVTRAYIVRDDRSEDELTRAEPDTSGTVQLQWQGAWLVNTWITGWT